MLTTELLGAALHTCDTTFELQVETSSSVLLTNPSDRDQTTESWSAESDLALSAAMCSSTSFLKPCCTGTHVMELPTSKEALMLDGFPVDIARASCRRGRNCSTPFHFAGSSNFAHTRSKKVPVEQQAARAAAANPCLAAEVLKQTESLSQEFFGENIPQHGGWRLNLLVAPELKQVLFQEPQSQFDFRADHISGGTVTDGNDDSHISNSQITDSGGSSESDGNSEVVQNPLDTRETGSDVRKVFILGFISFRFRKELFSMEVLKVAVRSDCQRRGYGRRLVRHVVEKARKTDGVSFASLSSLKDSIAFYRRVGFSQIRSDYLAQKIQATENGEKMYEDGQAHMEIAFRKKKTLGLGFG